MLDSGSPVKHETVRKVKNVASDTIGNRHFSNKLALKVQSKVVDALGPTEAENFDNATKARFQQLVKDPTTAKQMAQLRAKGLPDAKSRFQHQIKNGSNGMVRMLKGIKNQMEDGEGTEDVAKSMAELLPVVKKKIKRVWGY